MGGPTEYFAKTYEPTWNTVNGLAFFTKCLAFASVTLAIAPSIIWSCMYHILDIRAELFSVLRITGLGIRIPLSRFTWFPNNILAGATPVVSCIELFIIICTNGRLNL